MAEAALSNTREQWFQWSKYLIYALLFANIFAFFAEEWAAAGTHADGRLDTRALHRDVSGDHRYGGLGGVTADV